MLRRCAFPAWHFLWFWICSLIRSWLVCVVSILIPCIPGLISICFRIQKSSILRASQISSKNKKVPKNQHFFTHHPYFLDINTTHSTWLDTSILMSEPPDVRGNKSSRFHLKKSKFASSASSPLVRGNISTISGNPREMGLFQESGKPIVSTLICSASAWDFIASTLIPPMTEFVFFPASTWTRIITAYLFRPVCSFLNHKWYFAIIHK